MGNTWVRGAVFLAAVLYMQAGPLWTTGFRQQGERGFRAWQMYHSVGHEECKVSVFALENGEHTPVDWASALPKDEGDKTRSFVKQSHAVRQIKKLCNDYPPRVGLSVVMTCAKRRRWGKPSDTRDDDICPRLRRKEK